MPALDRGWHLAPKGEEDNHIANWGRSRRRTGLWITEITAENVLAGLGRMATFYTDDPDASLKLVGDGEWLMGSTLYGSGPHRLTVSVEHSANRVTQVTGVEIVSVGGAVVARHAGGPRAAHGGLHGGPAARRLLLRAGDARIRRDPYDLGAALRRPVSRREIDGTKDDGRARVRDARRGGPGCTRRRGRSRRRRRRRRPRDASLLEVGQDAIADEPNFLTGNTAQPLRRPGAAPRVVTRRQRRGGPRVGLLDRDARRSRLRGRVRLRRRHAAHEAALPRRRRSRPHVRRALRADAARRRSTRRAWVRTRCACPRSSC